MIFGSHCRIKEQYQGCSIRLFRPRMTYLILAAGWEIKKIYVYCDASTIFVTLYHIVDNCFRIYNIGSIYSEDIHGFESPFIPPKSSMTQRKSVWYRTDLNKQKEFSSGETCLRLWLGYELYYPGIVYRFPVSGRYKSVHARDKFNFSVGRPVTCC